MINQPNESTNKQTMCSPSKGHTANTTSHQSSSSSSFTTRPLPHVLRQASLIVVPIIAGLFHLHVFYHAAFTFLLSLPTLSHTTPSSQFYLQGYLLERAVFLAYTFDLLCCYVFKVIPFSRCNTAKDIAGHHIPILLGLMPLYIPTWAEWRNVDPMVHNVLDYQSDGGSLRYAAMYGLIKANGLGFFSSLNEFIMCFQRAEMSLQGVDQFQDEEGLKKMRYRFMTSRFIIGVELYFKFGIFCVFSIFGFVACCGLDLVWYRFFMEEVYAAGTGGGGGGINNAYLYSIWYALRYMASSPMFWRSVLFRLFLLTMYPFMGIRTFFIR